MYILKYKEAEYTGKINTLEEYYNKLNTHLSNLENYKDEINQFWNGDEASATMYEVLSNTITAVRRSMERTQTSITMCKNAVLQLTAAGGTLAANVDTALSAAKLAASL